MKGRYDASYEVSKVRIKQWHDIFKAIEARLSSINGLTVDNILESFGLGDIEFLTTKESIKTFINCFGKELYNELSYYSNSPKTFVVRMSYLQKEPDGPAILIRHKDNLYSSIDPDTPRLVVDRGKRLARSRFTKNDGSLAGRVWELNEPIFVPDTVKEEARAESERNYKVLRNMSMKMRHTIQEIKL